MKAVVRTRKNGYSDYKIQHYEESVTKIVGAEPSPSSESIYMHLDSNLRLYTFSSAHVALPDDSA